MMLLLISSLMVIVYFLLFYMVGRKKREFVHQTTSKCIGMAYGMISGTTIGMLIAFYIPRDLAISTVIAIVVSTLFAFGIGQQFGIGGIIEAVGSSFMGAMMGAMLAEMIPATRQTFIIVSMDLIYIFVVLGLLALMNYEEKKVKKTLSQLKIVPFLILFLITFSSICAAASVEMNSSEHEAPMTAKEHHH